MREETFGKFGLQQIQASARKSRPVARREVDCAFIGEMVRDFLENEDVSVLDGCVPFIGVRWAGQPLG